MSDPRSYVQRFLLDDLDIRGALVLLDDVWQDMQLNRNYPTAVRDLLGQMSAIGCVIGGNLKQPGRLTMQLQGHGPVNLLVVDVTETLNLRGHAKSSDEAVGKAGVGELIGDGQLLLTLDMPELRHPYQSYVPIEGDTIAEIFDTYGGWNWRAAIAAGSIGTSVGSTIAAGIAKGAADTYLATAEKYRDQFTTQFPGGFPGEAQRLETEIVGNARRADMLGGYPTPDVREAAKAFQP